MTLGDISEEVVRGLSGDVWLPTPRCRVELKEGILQGVIQLHDCSLKAIKKIDENNANINLT